MERLSHIAHDGSAQMVDVSAKPLSTRVALAAGRIRLSPETLGLISQDRVAKGNVFAVARVAGIQAAKQTSQLIPLCHNIDLSHVEVTISALVDAVEIQCAVRTTAQTGVEMEALIGVSVALLTVYDMCKAVDKDMQISDIRLIEKTKQELRDH